ncbi:Rab family GTPase [Maribacter sp. TH_r10]|uniref:GTP-binding protein n=1 Tax=Maribacter luteus TaxID=2594478 RepID=A0A6I2MK22_9FLAO|nr:MULTISPECIES: Rab family GTPase [Maribacter]MDV7137395.1 Rab family GTPase [Maribacter sp. TH_r10]MRX64123.1 GTP-binding protein [Maribacter luteus]|tara:strand:- start:829 stop:1326 length:498 start_codon:yes stop_codon:yes gene_type:complete
MQKSKKIVILGHFGVGKTSLIRRFVEDSFSDKYKVTIGVHITKKVVEVNADESVSLIIWDLEGTDEVQMIRQAYLLGTHGVVFVFDVSRPSTFQNLNRDLEIVAQKTPDTPLIVVGNKKDLVINDELQILLKDNGIKADYLTSAKTGDSVNEMFTHLATLLNDLS